MDSTVEPIPSGADEVVLVGEDSKPNADYERIVREELARVQERLAQLAPAGKPATAPPEVKLAPAAPDTSGSDASALAANISAFRAADVHGLEGANGRPPRKRGLGRFLIALLLAGTIVGAGAAWANYGEAIRPMIASWAPEIDKRIADLWSQASERLRPSGDQGAAPTQTAATDATATQAATPQASPAQTADSGASPMPAAPVPSTSADVGQMLQGMARDIASLQQGIDQLKAGQEQMARDNAKLSEQLKASQEQLNRVMARATEASLHPRPPQPAARPAPTVAHRPPPLPPVSSLPPPQTIAPPPQAAASATQLPAEDAPLPGGPRPPKPVP
jgi:hypothetical protein